MQIILQKNLFKRVIAACLIAWHENNMAHHTKRIKDIEQSLEYEMRVIDVTKRQLRDEIRKAASEMIVLHWREYHKAEAKMKQVINRNHF